MTSSDFISEEVTLLQRAALNSDKLTRVTLETFMKWKVKKKQEKIKALMKSKDSKKKDFAQGKAAGISGREMFEFNPDLVANEMEGEEGGADIDLSAFKREDEDEQEDQAVVDIDLESLAASAREADNTGTRRGEPASAAPNQALSNGVASVPTPQESQDESDKLCMAAGGASSEDPGLETAAATLIDVPIDENLFDDDDLLEVDQELAQLEIES